MDTAEHRVGFSQAVTSKKCSRVRPLNPMSRHNEGNQAGGDDQEDGEEVLCGQCEDPPVRMAKDPRMPTQAELDEHEVNQHKLFPNGNHMASISDVGWLWPLRDPNMIPK